MITITISDPQVQQMKRELENNYAGWGEDVTVDELAIAAWLQDTVNGLVREPEHFMGGSTSLSNTSCPAFVLGGKPLVSDPLSVRVGTEEI